MLTKKTINNGVFGASAGFFEIEPIYIKYYKIAKSPKFDAHPNANTSTD